MFEKFLATNRNFCIDNIDQHLIAQTFLVKIDVFLVYLDVVLFIGLVLAIVDDLVSL